MLFTNSDFGFILTAIAHLVNINKGIYISGQKWENDGLQYL